MIVYEALKHSLTQESNRMLTGVSQTKGQDSSISLLIHDVFGAETFKTHKKRKWHFYNRIDGERIVFLGSINKKRAIVTEFEDIPADPDETSAYVDDNRLQDFPYEVCKSFRRSSRIGEIPNRLFHLKF